MVKIGIIAAMPSEAKALKNIKGRFFGEIPFRVYVAGPGYENAKRAAEQLLGDGYRFLISWGVGGGLDSSLKPGRLVISREIVSVLYDTLKFDDELGKKISAALGELDPYFGRVISSPTPISSPAEKSILKTASRAHVVDMESAAIANVAAINHCDFLCIRSIVDCSKFQIPSAALVAMHSTGFKTILKVIKQLAHEPKDIKNLLALSFHFLKALRTLRSAAKLLGK